VPFERKLLMKHSPPYSSKQWCNILRWLQQRAP